MKLLIDTWGWITLSNKREPRHEEVRIFYEDSRRKKGVLYTTDDILNETITLLFRHLPFETAKEGLEKIERGISEDYLILKWITQERFKKARDLRLRDAKGYFHEVGEDVYERVDEKGQLIGFAVFNFSKRDKREVEIPLELSKLAV